MNMKKLFLFIAIFLVGLVMTGCEKTNTPASPKDDKTPPTVLSGSPDENAADVSVKSKIIVTFSKKMDTFSAKDAFSISPSVKGTVEWSNGDTVMTFTPNSKLVSGTTYKCSIAKNAADIDGNTLESQIQWNWTTATAKTAANEGKEACSPGTHWNAPRGKCVPNKPGCPPGTHWNVPGRNCVPNQPGCPPGTHWNVPGRKCVPNQLPDCSSGEHWNHRLERCETNRW